MKCIAKVERRIPYRRFNSFETGPCKRNAREGFRTCKTHWQYEVGMRSLTQEVA